MRPPATFWARYTSTDHATGCNWPTLTFPASGPLVVAAQGIAHVAGILFEQAAVGKLFVAQPSVMPSAIAPAMVSQEIDVPGFFGIVPALIDPSTTAFPFVIYWGPLGAGAR